MTALRGMARGWGYDIAGVDVLDAYAALMTAADSVGVDESMVKADVRALIAANRGGASLLGGHCCGSWLSRIQQGFSELFTRSSDMTRQRAGGDWRQNACAPGW